MPLITLAGLLHKRFGIMMASVSSANGCPGSRGCASGALYSHPCLKPRNWFMSNHPATLDETMALMEAYVSGDMGSAFPHLLVKVRS